MPWPKKIILYAVTLLTALLLVIVSADRQLHQRTGYLLDFDPTDFDDFKPITEEALGAKLYPFVDAADPTATQAFLVDECTALQRFVNGHSRLLGEELLVFVHGFKNAWNESVHMRLRDAALTHLSERAAFFMFDWSGGNHFSLLSTKATYGQAVANSRTAAGELSRFVECLLAERDGSKWFRLEHVHLVGFSLGAHVAGAAARLLSERLNKDETGNDDDDNTRKVGRISALDPAGPLYDRLHSNSWRLDRSDAAYVHAIHTSYGGLFGKGSQRAVGHDDFYPNGGGDGRRSNQPHCFDQPVSGSKCEHNAALRYFAESIAQPVETGCQFAGWPCASFAQLAQCDTSTAKARTMGYYAEAPKKRNDSEAKLFLLTSSRAPLCMTVAEQIRQLRSEHCIDRLPSIWSAAKCYATKLIGNPLKVASPLSDVANIFFRVAEQSQRMNSAIDQHRETNRISVERNTIIPKS